MALVESMAERSGGSARYLEASIDFWKEIEAPERALRDYGALIRKRPDSAWILGERADYRWENGDLDGAARDYGAALTLQPGRAVWIDRLRALEGPKLDASEGLPQLETVDDSLVRDGDRARAEAPPVERYPRAAATYLIDQMITTIDPEGGGSEYVHQLVRLDSDQAVEEFSTLSVPGEVLDLRIITPTGAVLHPTSGDGGGGYTLPGLSPGTFVEYRSVRRFDVGKPEDRPLGPFFFRDPQFQNAFHLTEWIVRIPENWALTVRAKNLPHPAEESVSDGMRQWRWTYREMEPLLPEFRAPAAAEVLPNVVLLPHRDWNDAVESISLAGSTDEAVTPTIEAAMESILRDAEGEGLRERAYRIYDAVCDRITNPSGASSATGVWLERAGDRDALFASLLEAAGVPFDRVLGALRDDFAPYRDWTEPDLGAFVVRLFRIPTDDEPLFMTTAFRMARPGRIPSQVQGGRGLVVRPGEIEWIRLPMDPIDREARTLEATFRLPEPVPGEDPGPVAVEARVEFRQLAASSLKERLANVNDFQRTAALESFVRSVFRKARVEEGRFLHLDDRQHPFGIECRVRCESPGVLGVSEGGPALQAVFTPGQMKASFVRESQRQFPYVSDVENVLRESLRVELGSRYRLRRLPDDVALNGPWGSYMLRFRLEGRAILVERALQLQPFILAPERVGDFYDFCTAVDEADESQILLELAR
ncbi:MAG: hypothetical protein KDC38_03565 [Planctomycetes bacterium]|nr:hypothetical protein [Planctomycetota bacterium]